MGKTDGDLAALIGQAKTPPPAAEAIVSKSETPKVQESKSSKVKESRTSKKATPRKAKVAGPKYQTMVAKEARLRPDQIDELSRVARELQRNRTTAGERITANTLIRIAVDRLLADTASLSGDDEAELLKSLG